MNVVIISIGTELLLSDILDTNASHVTRRLRESDIALMSKITIGDEQQSIEDAVRSSLKQADVVITIGGLGYEAHDLTRQSVAAVTGRELLADPPGVVAGAVILARDEVERSGLLLEEEDGILICLPGKPRDMAYLLETEVIPYLRGLQSDLAHGWLLLRTAGIMKSNLEQQLSDLEQSEQRRISLSSHAGQTDIGLWVQEDSAERVESSLQELANLVGQRLGDQIYGQEGDRLENVILQQLHKNGVRLAVAECHTGLVLARTFSKSPDSEEWVSFATAESDEQLANDLELEPLSEESDLTRWCRLAAEKLRQQAAADIGLVVYNNFTPGGVQLLVTLASSLGVSVMQRSFGGHPENINQWAGTLGLVHVRRWLLAHHPQPLQA